MLILRLMTSADIVLGMRLETAAGWNQVTEDWEILLSAGGSWVALWNSTPVLSEDYRLRNYVESQYG